jgi:hypothetical protein
MKLDINLPNKLGNSGMDISFMAIKTNWMLTNQGIIQDFEILGVEV